MKVLVTGAAGFVGSYYIQALRKMVPDVEIISTARVANTDDPLNPVLALDVTDKDAIQSLFKQCNPTHVMHLAGIAAPKNASANPDLTWQVHLQSTLHIANTIIDMQSNCILLMVSSGQIYGSTTLSGQPMQETDVLAPVDEYGVTKAAADIALGGFIRRGLHPIRLRPFNHTGAGQNEMFVLPNFAMQIARIEAGLVEPIIRVGNLDALRDILDVRDVADAYALATIKARELPPGIILNIASGKGRSINAVLDMLLKMSNVSITVETQLDRMRPSDLPVIIGAPELAKKTLGWEPNYDLEMTVSDILNYCRKIVETEQSSAKGRV